MSDLDFSALSDDQVLELAVAIAREAVGRHPAMRDAFKAAIATEAQRLDAAASGTEAARVRTLQDIRKSAEDAAYLRSVVDAKAAREKLAAAFGLTTLASAAAVVGRAPRDITVIVELDAEYSHRASVVKRVLINAGTLGNHASWHLCEYTVRTGSIRTSPGLQPKAGALAAWAKKTALDAVAAGLHDMLTLIGAELYRDSK